MIEKYLEIAFNDRMTSDTFLMGMRSPEIVAAARPGQFVMIRVQPAMDPLLRRPFSICGTQGDDICLILYRIVGRGTAMMAELEAGERLSVLGPLGKGFGPPQADEMPLLVAGGIGLAPLFFLAQSLQGMDFQMMAGFVTTDAIILRERLSDLPIRVSIATDDGSSGHAGPVTDLLEDYLRTKAVQGRRSSIFTCGPRPMLKKVVELALPKKITCQTSLETAMACGLGACQGCAVRAAPQASQPYYRVCKDGPVFAASSIDWKGIS